MARIGFIGLGAMGYPMAGHLVADGHDVVVFNRTSEIAQRFVDEHSTASIAATPAEAADGADAAILIVGNDESVRAVALGDDGAVAGLGNGSVLIDHTTASATIAHELAEAAGHKSIGALDAPVSGGESGAQNGVLTVMCGGSPDTFARADELMSSYAKTRTLIGATGAGQTTKMVNQVAIAGLLQGLAEALNLGVAAGLDMERVLATITDGAAGSWQMANRGTTMVADEFDFGFASEWMVKDLGIALEEAERLGAPTPIATLVASYYDEIVASGEARSDTSVLIRRLRP